MENKDKKILIADPDGADRSMLRAMLGSYENVFEAADGAEADAFMTRNPDTSLVLLSYDIPKLDGSEILSRMRLSPYLQNIPVIVLTGGEPDAEFQQRALKLGATEFAYRPYRAPLLRQRVANLLRIPVKAAAVQPTSFSYHMYTKSQGSGAGIAAYEFTRENELKNIYFSPSFAHIAGYTTEEYQTLVDNGSDIYTTIHPEDFPSFRLAMETLSADRHPVCQNFGIQRQDGTVQQVTFYADIYAGSHDTVFHIVCVKLPEDSAEPASTRVVMPAEAVDRLTGIANRAAFFRTTRKLLDEHRGGKYVLVVTDIDRFSVVNDLFGTKVGDNILIQIAARFHEMFSGLGTLGRIGSDSFAFCVPEERFDVQALVRDEGTMSDSFGLHYNLTIHNGIYRISEPDIEIAQMCDRATLALASVRTNYIKRYAYYDETMRQAMLAEQEILNNMHQAIQHGDFVIYLQPVYSLNFNKPVSAEALVRWKHPTSGLIAPGRFIPLFEKNRFITNLDRYMWELSVKFLSTRKERGLPMIPVSVNVSRANLFNPGLVDTITGLLRKYRVSNSYLRLEITESAYMDHPQQLISATRALRDAGFKILIDDFGSGYSSLKMLKDIPLDILKIDMSFIEDLETSSRAAAVLLGVIRLAQSLGMVTVAEGVETKFQLDFLRTAGCDNIQGYYYSKPLTTDAFEKLLEDPPTV